MDFLFHVPFFCTDAAVVAEILTVCLYILNFVSANIIRRLPIKGWNEPANIKPELSRATLGLSFSSLRLLKIKLFKPENSKNQAFQAWPNFFGKLPFLMVTHHLKHMNS
jgi:hypothetical protein